MRKQLMLLLMGVLFSVIPAYAQVDNSLQLRVAHWSQDAPPVDIYANGELVIEALEYPMVTEWMTLDDGLYDIAIAPAGTSLEEAVIGPLTFDLVRGTWVTIAAVGSVEAGTLATNVLIEDYSPMLQRDAESARVSITHAIDGAPPITMMIDDIFAATSLAYPGTKGNNDGFFVRNIPAGTADISVFLTNQPNVELASESGVTLEAGMNYLLAAIGTADAPELLIVGSSFDGEMMMVSDMSAMAVDTTSDETMSEDDSSDEAMTDETMSEDDDSSDEAMTDETMSEDDADSDEAMSDEAMSEDDADSDEAITDETMSEDDDSSDEAMTDETMSEDDADSDEAMTDETKSEDDSSDEAITDETMSEDDAASDEAMTDETMSEDDADSDEAMPESTEEPMDADMSEISNTIVDIVVATEANEAEFSVLLAALVVADESIVATLGDPDADLTVFAPTDEAFVALLDDMGIDIETLLSDTELLDTVLQYHVVEGAVMAETVLTMDGEAVPTLLGEDATISIAVTDDGVVLNDSSNVIETDITADNGVIHVIDGVLVPATETE